MNSRKFVAGAASVLMAASMVGCSSSSAPAEGGSSSTSGAGGTLIVGSTQTLSGVFNPLYSQSAYDMWVNNMVYQSMIAYNADNELYPQAAAELPEVSEDGKTITFKLKEGQKFNDGTDLNADDVKFTFTLMADPAYVGQLQDGVFNFIEGWSDYQEGNATEVSGIEVVDDYTITFHCAESDIEASNTIGGMSILSDEAYAYTKGDLGDYAGNMSDNPIGSGAYKLNKYDAAAGASCVLNENYTGDGEYGVQNVVIRTISAGTEVESLQNGDINLLPEQIDTSIVGPASMLEGIAVQDHFRAAEGYFGYNCDNGVTADQTVRQALSYATNRAEFRDAYYKWPEKDGVVQASDAIKDVSAGYTPTVFWSPVAKTLGSYVTGDETLDGLTNYDYNPEKAKQLLTDDGWTEGSSKNESGVPILEKDGQQLVVNMLCTPDNSVLDTLIPIIKKDWESIGVKFNQTTIEFNAMADKVDPNSTDTEQDWNVFFMAVSYTGLSNDMLSMLGYNQKTGTLQGQNYARIKDEELNNDLWAGRQTGDEEVSIDNYKKAMIRTSEVVPYLPIYGNQLFDLYSDKIQNLHTGSVCNWSQALEGVSIAE